LKHLPRPCARHRIEAAPRLVDDVVPSTTSRPYVTICHERILLEARPPRPASVNELILQRIRSFLPYTTFGYTSGFDDITHYRNVVTALGETIRLMDDIDRTIPTWPIA
jgi:hypothetical protein